MFAGGLHFETGRKPWFKPCRILWFKLDLIWIVLAELLPRMRLLRFVDLHLSQPRFQSIFEDPKLLHLSMSQLLCEVGS